jgi:glutathionyl-hydroquinone reductase
MNFYDFNPFSLLFHIPTLNNISTQIINFFNEVLREAINERSNSKPSKLHKNIDNYFNRIRLQIGEKKA